MTAKKKYIFWLDRKKKI